MDLLQLALFLGLMCFFMLVIAGGVILGFGERALAMVNGFLTPNATGQAYEMPPDMARYFELKNRSCNTLAGKVLIATEDTAVADVVGLGDGPEERLAVDLALAEYLFNATTKTYVSGEKMKKVTIAQEGNTTTIWKDGRIYYCSPGCTMRLLTPEEYREYRAGLETMRTSCAYFGNTEPPEGAEVTRLLSIASQGTKELYGHRCESFLVSGNATYAQALLKSGNLTDRQKELLWALGHFAVPMHECLEEDTGIIVAREATFDLTDSYRFEFMPGGHLYLVQETKLTYFDDRVPDSFFAIPS
jgi:hypothetical protein